jgi:hypothetical protein
VARQVTLSTFYGLEVRAVTAVIRLGRLSREEEGEEEFITSGNWRGKHNSLSRGAGADQP